MGMCNVLWRRGQQRQPQTAPKYFNNLNIVDAREREEPAE